MYICINSTNVFLHTRLFLHFYQCLVPIHRTAHIHPPPLCLLLDTHLRDFHAWDQAILSVLSSPQTHVLQEDWQAEKIEQLTCCQLEDVEHIGWDPDLPLYCVLVRRVPVIVVYKRYQAEWSCVCRSCISHIAWAHSIVSACI